MWATKFHTLTQNRQNCSSLYRNLYTLDSNLLDKRFCTEWQQEFPDFNLLLISSWIELWFVRVVPKYLNCSTVSNWPTSLCKSIHIFINYTVMQPHHKTMHNFELKKHNTTCVWFFFDSKRCMGWWWPEQKAETSNQWKLLIVFLR
jgi:hypothetical protein